MSDVDYRDELLRTLQAHGQQFLDSFGVPLPTTGKRKRDSEQQTSKRKRRASTPKSGNSYDTDEEGEEWNGFGSAPNEGSCKGLTDQEESDSTYLTTSLVYGLSCQSYLSTWDRR